MKKVRKVFLDALEYLLSGAIITAIIVVPITITLGCIKLIMMMFGR